MASGIPKRERLERIKVIVDGAIARSKRPNKEKSPAMTFVRDELTPDELARIYALACNQPEDWRP